MAWIKQHTFILLILLVATVLRFWAFWEIPFSHDELSALLRTQISTWSEFIERGIKMDNHPGGVQLLIWLQTSVGGYGAYWIKLPFLVAGVWCVWMIYLVGRRLFSEPVALTAAALMATLQFPITFSQWARPYIIGLLIVLTITWLLLRFVQADKRQWLWISAYAVLCALSGYTHYFTLLQAIVISIAFLPYLSRNQFIKITIGGLIAFVLWLPHLELTLFHLDRGGIGNWLQAPTAGYWLEIIAYTFQYSVWVPLVLLIASFSRLLDIKHWWKVYSRFFLSICAATPYLIGYVYSVQVNPLLHQSVLIFSMPFLLLFCASFVTEKRPMTEVVVILIIAINVNVLVVDRKHYELNYQSEYISPINWLHDLNASHAMIPALFELREDFTEMIFNRSIAPSQNVQLADPLLRLNGLDEYLNNLKSDHLFFAMNSGSDPELFASVLDHFPCIDSVQYYHAGEAYLLNKDCDSRKVLATDTVGQALNISQPYSTSVEVVVDDPGYCIAIHAMAEVVGTAEDASLVMEVKSETAPSWRGVRLDPKGVTEAHFKAFNVYYFDEWDVSVDDQIKSFVWLNSSDSIFVSKLSLYTVPANPNKFKLFKP